jgi:hypothetical protein
MSSKSDVKATGADRAVAASLGMNVSPEQARLVENKIQVLRKARDLQNELARVRSELTRIDEEMLKAGFHLPALACW